MGAENGQAFTDGVINCGEASTENSAEENKKRSKKKRASESTDVKRLRIAAGRIADLLCELSSDDGLFVSESGQAPKKRLDTKALKEFSSVIKEMSAVMAELYGDGVKEKEGILIEFSDEALEMGR